MDAGKGEVINSGCSAMLPRNNVIYLERRWGEMLMAIGNIRSVLVLVAKLADEICVQYP
jgi:hypothetical protein